MDIIYIYTYFLLNIFLGEWVSVLCFDEVSVKWLGV